MLSTLHVPWSVSMCKPLVCCAEEPSEAYFEDCCEEGGKKKREKLSF
jgi:hypothetical protein